MKLDIHENCSVEEPEVEIRCVKRDGRIQRIADYIQKESYCCSCNYEEKSYRIPIYQILYIESVERKTFLYTEQRVYESKKPLQDWERLLMKTGILRVSKSVLLNTDCLECVRPFSNHRLEAKGVCRCLIF